MVGSLGILGRDGCQPQNPPGQPSPNTLQKMAVHLCRHTGLDRTCRVKFNIKVGGENDFQQAKKSCSSFTNSKYLFMSKVSEAELHLRAMESGILDEMSDVDGRYYKICFF